MRTPHGSISLLSTALAGLLITGCVKEVPPPDGPLSVRVTFDEAAAEDIGADTPLPFSHDSVTFTVDMQMIDIDGSVMTGFDGELGVRVRPGKVVEPWTVTVTDGVAEDVQVTIKGGHGPTRIWFEDSEREGGNFATGVTPEIRFAYPTVAQIQTPSDSSTDLSGLMSNHVQVLVEDRELIVTHVASDGFYVTDTDDPAGAYNSIYAFTFSRPRDLEAGDRLSALDGNVVEYIAFTELGYPSFIVESSGHDSPAPSPIGGTELCGGTDTMEGYESSMIIIENAVSAFADADDCESYLEYGQWPIRLEDAGGDCGTVEMNVVSSYTIPGLRFTDCLEGQVPGELEIDWMIGTLRHIKYADPPWIIEPRGCEDIPEEIWPEDCIEDSAAARAHFSGPTPGPRQYERRIPFCEEVPYALD
jgi:hypothetical protein